MSHKRQPRYCACGARISHQANRCHPCHQAYRRSCRGKEKPARQKPSDPCAGVLSAAEQVARWQRGEA